MTLLDWPGFPTIRTTTERMRVPIEYLIAAITALGALLVFTVRLFLTGQVLPRNAVPREDYDAQKAINKTLVDAIPPLTDAVKQLVATVESLRNGGAK